MSSVMVSFYLHNRQGNQYDREVIVAARDVGIRLIFERMTYDIVSPQAYEAKRLLQEIYFETYEKGEAYLRELMDYEGPNVVVAPTIHSMYASSGDVIVRALNLGAELDRL
ncbi:MAG: hypothetical protein CSA35_05355 [Dethiosulfovibrio peptidovorans]|nr:MAG: hypothetical protein CSA35_05355 [Dethiosulfovibrio peptidovorans]